MEKWGENARQTCLVALRIMKLAELSNANLFEAVLWFTLFHISFVYYYNILDGLIINYSNKIHSFNIIDTVVHNVLPTEQILQLERIAELTMR